MFNNEDFDQIKKMMTDIPDGILDGSDAHQMLEAVTDILSETDFSSDESRMEMMMNCINLCFEGQSDEAEITEDRVFGVILGLTFNYSNIICNLQYDGFNTQSYFSYLKSDVLPTMAEESKNLPYWDVFGDGDE